MPKVLRSLKIDTEVITCASISYGQKVSVHFVPTIRNMSRKRVTSHSLTTREGIHPENHNITWTLFFDFFGRNLIVKNEYQLSHAIDKIRTVIEFKSYRMLVKWSELDAHQSGMLGDMSAGTLAQSLMELEKFNTQSNSDKLAPGTVHVLDETQQENAVSLEEQRIYRENFFKSIRSHGK